MRIYYWWFSFVFVVVAVNVIYPQIVSNGLVFGIIRAESTKKPVEFAYITLHNQTDSTLIEGTVSDKAGKFRIKNIKQGKYYLKLSFMGCKDQFSKGFDIDSENRSMDLGIFYLTESPVVTDEVVVTSGKNTFSNTIDRKVYNVDQDLMSKSGTASDVLQNIPSVQVDIDGNVSLRGSENVMMLINGKSSPLMGASRSAVLQQLPASAIDKIEVITNPSAKYRPDGTSGMINIVLKKNADLGLNGNINANLGNQSRYNGNITLNFNPGDFNISGNYGYRQDDRTRLNNDSREQFDILSQRYVDNETRTFERPLSQLAALAFEYNIDKLNSLGISGNYLYRGFNRSENSLNSIRDNNNSLTESYWRNRSDDEFEKESEFTAFYQHNFGQKDHELRVEFNSAFQPEQEDNHYTNIYDLPRLANQYDNTLIKQTENNSHLTAEYKNPLSEEATLEAGYNGEFNSRDQDFYAEIFNAASQSFIMDKEKTNRFLFDQSTHAIYATYENTIGSFGFLAGMRLEKAFVTSNLVTLDSLIKNDYLNLFPTLHLKYEFSNTAQLQLNYSRRANRPEGDELNPFPEYRDQRNLRAGNPKLLPEYVHSLELGCNLQNEYFSVIPSVYYRYTYNKFTSITKLINDSTLLTTNENLSNDQSAGFEFIISANAGKIFSSNLSANVFYNKIDASNLGYGNSKSTVSWSGSFNGNINITRTTMLQVNSVYRSSRLTPQGEYFPSFVFNMGMRQDLFDDQVSLTLAVSDVFATMKRKVELTTPLLNETSVNSRDSRIIYLGLTYRFGSQAEKSNDKPLKYDDSM